jgi:hypothetical protein
MPWVGGLMGRNAAARRRTTVEGQRVHQPARNDCRQQAYQSARCPACRTGVLLHPLVDCEPHTSNCTELRASAEADSRSATRDVPLLYLAEPATGLLAWGPSCSSDVAARTVQWTQRRRTVSLVGNWIQFLQSVDWLVYSETGRMIKDRHTGAAGRYVSASQRRRLHKASAVAWLRYNGDLSGGGRPLTCQQQPLPGSRHFRDPQRAKDDWTTLWQFTGVSEEPSASIFRVEEQTKHTRSKERPWRWRQYVQAKSTEQNTERSVTKSPCRCEQARARHNAAVSQLKATSTEMLSGHVARVRQQGRFCTQLLKQHVMKKCGGMEVQPLYSQYPVDRRTPCSR